MVQCHTYTGQFENRVFRPSGGGDSLSLGRAAPYLDSVAQTLRGYLDTGVIDCVSLGQMAPAISSLQAFAAFSKPDMGAAELFIGMNGPAFDDDDTSKYILTCTFDAGPDYTATWEFSVGPSHNPASGSAQVAFHDTAWPATFNSMIWSGRAVLSPLGSLYGEVISVPMPITMAVVNGDDFVQCVAPECYSPPDPPGDNATARFIFPGGGDIPNGVTPIVTPSDKSTRALHPLYNHTHPLPQPAWDNLKGIK